MRTTFLVASLAGVAATASVAAGELRVRGVGFELHIDSPAATRDESSAISLELRAADGRKLNDDYPIKIVVDGPDDVVITKRTLGPNDATTIDGLRAAFSIGWRGKATGVRQLDLDVRFAVCSSVACELQHRAVAVPLSIH